MKNWERPLAEPAELKRQLLHMAALDVIMSEEEWLRVYRYIPAWKADAALGIVENGAGDDVYVVFAAEGVIIKGFDHMSPLSPHARDEYGVWPGMYETAPAGLLAYLDNDLFEREDVTFCVWRQSGDSAWKTGDLQEAEGQDDGADFLLGYLENTPEEHAEWAVSYYEKPVDLEAIRGLFAGAAVTEELIKELNPQRSATDALAELESLGLRANRGR
ncbi:hypothetical protein [Paenibacillus sp. 1P03SA]|uniref:hypothetical protein n=1 Tax=Paenibacillus sp. 1P03SA TaxID=3132294 RepID=UPI00399FF021